MARIAALCAGVVALFAFLYGAFLLGAVVHTAAQTKARAQTVALASEVSALETRYFAIIRSITPERAQELGLSTPKESTTVFATVGSKAISLQGFRGL